MSIKRLPARRPETAAWASLLACSVAFVALTVTRRWMASGISEFVLLAAVVSFRPRLFVLGLAVLLGPLVNSSSWLQAGAGAGLLLAGPFIVSRVVVHAVEARRLWKRADTPAGRALVVRELGPRVKVLVATGFAIGGFLEGGWFVAGAAEIGVLVIPLMAYQRSCYKTATATGAAAAWITSWSAVPLALAAASLGMEIFRVSTGRLPRQWHPLPSPSIWRYPMQAARCLLCDLRIRRSEIIPARRWLGPASGQWAQYRAALLDLEERLYQPALSFGREMPLPNNLVVPAQILQARGLSGTAQFDKARALYARLLSEVRHLDDRLYSYLILYLAENELAAGQSADAVRAATWLTERPGSARDYFAHQRALRVLAQHELDQGNVKRASGIIERALDDGCRNRAIARLLVRTDPGKLVRRIYGNRGSMYMQILRMDALDHVIRPAKEADRDGWNPEAAAMAMSVARAADDLVELYLFEARRVAQSDGRMHKDALALSARALMELDRTRYLLAAQSVRTSWSVRFHRTLSFALDAAHAHKDHEFVAELLEFARVQTLPAATAETSGDLALSMPPVVLVNGRSRLARPGEHHRPAHVSLERAAERAAGADAWWLSFWVTEKWLYWALVSPAGAATSGRIAFAVGSALRAILDDLERALPVLLPGEDPAAADFRLAASPLLTDPQRELALSAALGNVLLPDELTQAAAGKRACDGTRLPLAIAPAAALGYVPWSILVAGGHGSADPDRLIDVCDWVLAPSAALICHAPAAARRRAPLALAIADTTDAPALGELPGARAQAAALPADVRVLGGRHWSGNPATISRLKQELSAIGPDTTVAFMCHAVRGSTDEPSKGGLVLASSQPEPARNQSSSSRGYDVLTPQAVFAMNKDGIRMPRQVILQACDTSALKDAISGEWLTIAPAFISAGTREVVATVYPLPDLPGIDDPVAAAALNGDTLQGAVARMQREGLLRWTSGQAAHPAHTPLAWAAYATIAVQPGASTSAVTDPAQPPVVSRSFMRILSDAVKSCLRTRGRRLDSGRILAELLDSGLLSDLLDGGTTSHHPAAFVWTLGPELCTRFLRIRDRGPAARITANGVTLDVPDVVINAIRDGRAAAERDGLPLTAHHVVTALLGQPTAARRILSFLARVTGTQPALIQRVIEFDLAQGISQRLEPWVRPDWADKHRDMVETLLTHAFAQPAQRRGASRSERGPELQMVSAPD